MKRFLLSVVMTAIVGSSVMAASALTDDGSDGNEALAAKKPGHAGHAPARPIHAARPTTRTNHAARPAAKPGPAARPVTRVNDPGRANARPNQAGHANTNHTGHTAKPNHTGHLAVQPGNAGHDNARPNHAGREHARPNPKGHTVNRRNEVPNWGKAARTLHKKTPAQGWHVRGTRGTFIARNYPDWSRNWWSAKWGRWFRFDPETSAYYYYEPAVGAYVEIETITTYAQPLEVPITKPTTDPDDIPDDDPPPPVEP